MVICTGVGRAWEDQEGLYLGLAKEGAVSAPGAAGARGRVRSGTWKGGL